MKTSPVQLLETVLERALVQPNAKYDPELDKRAFEELKLQFQFECEQVSDFWEPNEAVPWEGMENRTFRVLLGVRTQPRDVEGPYTFEIVCSGVVGCLKEKVSEKLSARAAVEEYGYAMLYGMAREQLLVLTSRMRFGARMLPTLSFMGHHTAVEERRLKQAEESVSLLESVPSESEATSPDTKEGETKH